MDYNASLTKALPLDSNSLDSSELISRMNSKARELPSYSGPNQTATNEVCA
jgi:hypothetical protein